jgi:hypothetical protein
MRVPCQLPSTLPELIGRDDTLAAGEQVLASATPWLAVTGPGGVGKTTFALCLADRARTVFPDGILVAGRGAEPVDESLLTRFLGAFGIPLNGQLPQSPRDRGELLWDLLGARRVLIVLDNVPDESYVRPLFPVAPGCGLVVTSRKRLAGLETLRGRPTGQRRSLTPASNGRHTGHRPARRCDRRAVWRADTGDQGGWRAVAHPPQLDSRRRPAPEGGRPHRRDQVPWVNHD